MPRPKSARKAPDAGSAFIRFSADEYARVCAAMEKETKGVLGASGVTVAAFCRDIVLKEVDKLLGGR